ncbi:MAG TPA: hypothetical protein VNH11_05505 [Pirellulales bacterium]|nr:hypothetical protein [Pirellulales bacterium]
MSGPGSNLESFVRDYVEVTGGVWDEIEPQVYDLLLRGGGDADGEREVMRVTFDPEALPEHPRAQLASFGTPLVNRLLEDAVARGQGARFYLLGLNLAPHQLAARVGRALTLSDGSMLSIERVRPLHFPQAVYWFEATFTSDQKEEELLPVAVDLHYGRQVRHFEQLLDASRLADAPSLWFPDAPCVSRTAAYQTARDEVARTLIGLANTRSRELSEHVERQIERMRRYYDELATELDESVRRAAARGADAARFAERKQAVERERALRIDELRRKSVLSVRLRLLNWLLVRQPKLLVKAKLRGADGKAGQFECVWDPLGESLEAVACAACGRPTFELGLSQSVGVVCLDCRSPSPASRRRPR